MQITPGGDAYRLTKPSAAKLLLGGNIAKLSGGGEAAAAVSEDDFDARSRGAASSASETRARTRKNSPAKPEGRFRAQDAFDEVAGMSFFRRRRA